MAEQVMSAKPRKSVGKRIGISVLVIVVLLGAAVAIVIGQIDAIVKRGVEEGGTYALGTKTTLSSVNIGIMSGKVGLGGLGIASPAGFKSAEFFSLGDGAVEVTLGSLLKDVVEVPLIRFSTIRVNLEKKDGKTNYNTILESLKKVTGGSGAEPKPTEPTKGGGKKFIVKQILIKDVRVHVDLAGTGGRLDQLAEVNIPIEEVNLTNVGTAEDGGVDLQTLASVIVNAVLSAAAEKGDSLSPEFMAELRGELAGLQKQLDQVKGLRGAGLQVVGKSGEEAKKIGETLQTDVQKAVEAGDVEAAKKAAAEAAKKAVEGGKGTVESLKGLLPGKKKEEPK
jgi:hypothetical protein